MSWSQFKSYLLRHLPDDFVLVGWSMGGLYASRLAIEIPERIIHLINIASSPRFIKEDHWPGIDKSIFDGFFKNLTADPQQTISEFIGLQLKDQTYQYSHQFLPNTDSLKDGLTVLADWDLRQALSDFKKPASFLFGRLDAITPRTTMPVMQKLYPSFKYVMFSKAAHMPFLSHQDEFITTLETILT
ncbi:biotin biosynthesis protein BioH [Legionella hackeliae]|nr:biotin biosynthesis protein BioH [Legionella hackeliae]